MSLTKLGSIVKSTAIFLLILLLTLEFFSFVLSKSNLLLVNDTPWAYRPKDDKFLPSLQWRIEESNWGAWHKANAATKERQSCYDTPYYSNEVGARDDSFDHSKVKKRIALIGDSFAEGFGVKHEETAQYLIEKSIGAEVFNFGAAGDLGPVQYSIIFNELAKKYSPDALVVFFLPNNDFTDNDYEYWLKTKKTFKSNGSERWRPYYKKTIDGYESFIPEGATKTIEAKDPSFGNKYLWTHNIQQSIKFLLAQKREQKAQEAIVVQKNINVADFRGGYAGYFDATLDQQKAATFFIDKLIKDANVQEVILVVIPVMGDLGRIAAGEKPDNMFWYKQFQTAGTRLGKKVEFIDLSKYALSNPTQLFFSCDGHWSPYGNKWAADIVTPYLQ